MTRRVMTALLVFATLALAPSAQARITRLEIGMKQPYGSFAAGDAAAPIFRPSPTTEAPR